MDEPRLLLGPLLRYVGHNDATIWVETDRACAVTVQVGDLCRVTEPTWSVHGHHYALVQIIGLASGSVHPYSVRLDDSTVWPEAGSDYPPSVIRTLGDNGTLRLAFGSCRRVAPFDAKGLKGFGADALVAMAERMCVTGYEAWPDALFMAGDQIYADEPSPELTQRLLDTHVDPPEDRAEVAGEVWDFEEYTWLYYESWTPAPVRWLLSTVPTCMLLDDHDLRDDWNTSQAWRDEVTQTAWWRDRVVGAFGTYWVYQHLGNMSPQHLADDEMFALVRSETDDDARTAALDDFAWRSDAENGTARWSFVRDFGDDGTVIRLVAIDCRASRNLDPEHRVMVDDREWEWIVEQATATPNGQPIGHLLLGSTLPVLLARGIHHVEGFSEATAEGDFGRPAAAVAEWIRQAVDLEHWPAFRTSFDRMVELFRQVVRAPEPPASIVILSGDVHCSYTAQAHIADTAHPGTLIHQLTMSPFRNPLPLPIKVINKTFDRRGVRGALRRLSRAVDVEDTGLDWAVDEGPWFANGVMTVVVDGRKAHVEVDHAEHSRGRQFLRRTADIPLTAGMRSPSPRVASTAERS
ncbi:MAG: alkaline phosphatase D family protein [Dermatophilus congolensis]|nr:alkaline phosphatase D family protein [Dermatophilus congolensis]